MLETLRSVLRCDVATPDGWSATYALDQATADEAAVLLLRTENTLFDGDGWTTTIEFDLRDLDPSGATTEEDSDGISYLRIPTRYFRNVIAESHSRRKEPWKASSVRIPIQKDVETKRIKKGLKDFLSSAPPRQAGVQISVSEALEPFDEALPLLTDVPFSYIPRFPKMFIQRSVLIEPLDFEIQVTSEHPRKKKISQTGISILTIDTEKLSVTKPIQGSAYSFTLRDMDTSDTAWAASEGTRHSGRHSCTIHVSSHEEGERILALFREGIRRTREHKFWSEQGADGQGADGQGATSP